MAHNRRSHGAVWTVALVVLLVAVCLAGVLFWRSQARHTGNSSSTDVGAASSQQQTPERKLRVLNSRGLGYQGCSVDWHDAQKTKDGYADTLMLHNTDGLGEIGMGNETGTYHLTVSCPLVTPETGETTVSKSFKITVDRGTDTVIITMPYASSFKE